MIRLNLKLKESQPASDIAHSNEVRAGDFLPYLMHYDDHAMLLRDGGLCQILKVGGLPFDTADQVSLQRQKNFLSKLLMTVARSDYGVYLTTLRKRRPAYPAGEFQPGFAAEVNRAWKSRNEGRKQYINELYISIVRFPARKGINGIGEKLKNLSMKRLSHEEAKRELERKREEMAKELDDVVRRFEVSLGRYDVERLGMYQGADGWYSSAAEFLSYLMNWSDSPVRVPRSAIAHYLPRTRPIIGDEALEMRGATRSRVGAIVSIKPEGYPEETDQGQLDHFLGLPCEMIITHSFRFEDQADSTETVGQQQNRLEQSGDKALSQIDELDEAQDDIAARRIAFGWHHMTVCCQADNLRELQHSIEMVENAFLQGGLTSVRESLHLEGAFWAQFPGNFNRAARAKKIHTKNLAGFNSLHNFSVGKRDGNRWGAAITVLPTLSDSPYFFNWHFGRGEAPGHTTISAKTGRGKSGTKNFLVAQSMKARPRVFDFDCDRGSEVFCKAMRGRHSLLKMGTPSGMNPFALPDTTFNRSFLRRLITMMVTTNREVLSTEDERRIQAAVAGNYEHEPHERNLMEIAPYLGTSRHDSMRARLQKWLPGGQYAGLFDNREDRFDLSVDYCCFDMTEIFKDEAALELVLAYLIHRIDLVTDDGRPFIIVCEEGQRWVRSKFMAPILDNWLETVRKRNGMVIFITPDLAQTSGALAKQTVTQIFMGDDKGRREDYIGKFALSEAEFQWVREVDESARQALIKHGAESVIAQFDMSGCDLEKYLPILAGNPERAELLNSLINELGTDDPDTWIPIFLERCARKN